MRPGTVQVPLLDFFVIFALSVVAAIVCHRAGIPTSIGLLLAGVMAGPDAFGLVRNVHEIEVLAEIGVVLLLFVVGLEISVADVARLRRFFLIGGTVQFLGTALPVSLLLRLFGVSLPQGIYLGFVAALSSTAIVLRMLQEQGQIETPHGRSLLSILIYQDIAVVPVMLMAPLLAGQSGGSPLAAIAALVGKILLVGVFGVVAARRIVPWVLEPITRTRSSEAFLLAVFMLCVGIAVLTQSLGLSLALGAFLAGFILSESEYSHQAVSVMLPFRDVLMSLFFISVGMLLDIPFLLENPLRILLLTAGVLVIKPVVGVIASLAVGLPLRSSVLAGLPLGQVGEFSLVATKAGLVAGLLGPEIFQSVLDVAVLSMMATPLLAASAERLAVALTTSPLARLGGPATGSAGEEPPASGHGGHIVIVGFGVTGRNLALCARRSDVPYAIVEANAAIVRQARAAGEPIHFGDATHASILTRVRADRARAVVVVVDDPAAARRIVELSRRCAPQAFLLVRSRYLREVEPLMDLGADEVIADELEVSIEVFSRVLARMLVPRQDIRELIADVRGDWRRMARGLASQATSAPDLRVALPHLATHSLRLDDSSPLVGATIATSRLRADHGVTVLALTRAGRTNGNPASQTRLERGDILFVVAPEDWDPAAVLG